MAKAEANVRRPTLEEDLLATGPLREKSRKRKAQDLGDGTSSDYLDAKSSKRILAISQQLEEEDDGAETKTFISPDSIRQRASVDLSSDSESDSLAPHGASTWSGFGAGSGSDPEVDEEEVAAFDRMFPSSREEVSDEGPIAEKPDWTSGGDLAALILEKIAAREAQLPTNPHKGRPAGVPSDAVELPRKAVEVFEQVGLLLSRYKSGKLPKPFKILPTLPNWETYLEITKPSKWTANACFEATRIFVSRKPNQTRYFVQEVLLDRVRDEIRETKKLNVHLFAAVKKSMYKPAAFFKGFLFPLVATGHCSLREAHIIGSAIVRVSIPVLHSAAALLKLCEIAAELSILTGEAGGAINVFIRVLLDKKYALPYKVIDALVFHFLRYRGIDEATLMDTESVQATTIRLNEDRLPVSWHQSLLMFAQRHRNDITEDQREALLDLLLVKGHRQIGPEIRRELIAGRGRGMTVPRGTQMDGDDTMMTVAT